MRPHWPWVAGLVFARLPVAWSQADSDNPLSQLVSQALSAVTDVRSILSAQATAASASPASTASTASTASASTSSSSTSTSSSASSQASSATSSTFSTSSTPSTSSTGSSTQPASNTAEAAAASSSAAAAVAAADAQNGKSRTTAIILGVVLGLLALIILIGVLLFCLRRRRRRRAVGSRRSLSPEAVDGAPWGKERVSMSSTPGHATPSRHSTHERHHAPVGAAAPLMAEKASHGHSEHGAPGNSAPIPHRGAPNFQPGLMDGSSAGHQPHHTGHNHIPLSSHSRSGPAAAGLGGAALGGLAAKHHHDKHKEQDVAHQQPNTHRHSLSRKPVGGDLGHDTTGRWRDSNVVDDGIAPGHEARHSGLPRGDTTNSSEPLGMNGGTGSASSLGNGHPPAYNGTSHPLSSHPPFNNDHRQSTGHHEPLMAGAAGVGAGALGGAALAKHHDRGRTQDSPSTGRRSWDPNRQSEHPQSILANSNGRRSTGSTNPYVQARSPRRARFSDDVARGDGDAYSGHGKHDELPQDSPYPRIDRQESPRRANPVSDDAPSHPSPRPSMPGGWRGSGQFDRYSPRGSFSNDGPAAPMKHRNPSLSDLRQDEEDSWYRGRHMGGDDGATAAADPGRSSFDQRFYANRKVGQAL